MVCASTQRHLATSRLGSTHVNLDLSERTESQASAGQSAGVAQVGKAITQLDQTTQPNAALVKDMSATAEKLKVQAAERVNAMVMFKVQRSA